MRALRCFPTEPAAQGIARRVFYPSLGRDRPIHPYYVTS
ncbi:protein of unknown function [Pararobbsia alpina]